MEMIAEEQGHLGSEPEIGHQHDAPDYDQDDEFDFTLGGEEDLAPETDTHNLNSEPINETDGPESQDDTSYMYQSQEQAAHPSVALSQDEDGQDESHESNELLELEADDNESFTETNKVDETEQDGDQDGTEAAAQGGNEEHAEDIVGEEIYYDETAGEFESFENITQSELGHGQDSLNAMTSVDGIQNSDDPEDHSHGEKADQDRISGDNGAPSGVNEMEETAEGDGIMAEFEDGETAVEAEDEQVQDATVTFDDETNHVGGDAVDTLSSNNGLSPGRTDGSLDQTNWSERDHDEESTTRPKVMVSYRSQEYFLFAESSDQDPDHYFLTDLDSLHLPLSQFLISVRDVISEEVAPSQEIFIRVNGLGFEFAESTMKDFLEETTFAQIIEVNNQLVENDGGSPSPILDCYLGVRPSCLHRFAELSKAAGEGKGLSDLAMFYDDDSMGESVDNQEEYSIFQDIGSDDISLDDADDGNEDVSDEKISGEAGDSNDAEQSYNPFRLTEEQLQPMDDAPISVIMESEVVEPETFSVDVIGVYNTETDDKGNLDDISEDHRNDLEVNGAEMHESTVGKTGENEEAYDQHGPDDDEVLDMEAQAEVQLDYPQEEYEHTHGENLILFQDACGKIDLCLCHKCFPFCPVLGTLLPLGSGPEANSSDTGLVAGNDIGAHTVSTAAMSYSHGAYITEACHTGNNIMFYKNGSTANTSVQETTTDPTNDNDNDNDDDYLDLGNDDDHIQPAEPAGILGDEAVGFSASVDISRQLSHNSSATATLNGDDNGHEDDAPVNQDSAGLDDVQNEAELESSQNEIDEIDWNHDEDGELDVADQDPTNPSPSSPSAKRNREEEGGIDGSGNDNGACWYSTSAGTHANKLLAIKRRRT